jgi:hypothetical protein
MPPYSLPIGKWLTEPRSIVLLGLRGSGKTTFFRKLVDDQDTRPPPPTIAYNAVKCAWGNAVYSVVDVGGDGLDQRGSQAKGQFLSRRSIVFYIHDCSVEDNSQSVRVLHEHLDDLARAGVRHLWVILNKQGLASPEKGQVQAAKGLFETDLRWYSDQFLWKVVDLPGTSGLAGKGIDNIRSMIPPAFLSKFEPRKPTTVKGSIVTAESERRTSFSFSADDGFGKLPSDKFWGCILKGETAPIQHSTRVRAAYFIVLDSMQDGRSILKTADDVQSDEWMQFDPKHRGNRSVMSTIRPTL